MSIKSLLAPALFWARCCTRMSRLARKSLLIHPLPIFLSCLLHSPQLVRYFPNQRYDLHTDFWPRHQRLPDGSGRLFNRPASFFVFLRDNCTLGHTWFPSITIEEGKEVAFGGRVARGKEDGGDGRGVRFKPVKGSAVFWVNIGEDGIGDRRMLHAGLPVREGEKIGLNIWPRKFYAAQDD